LVEYLEKNIRGLVVAGYKHVSNDIKLLEELKADSDKLAASMDDLYLKKDITKLIETHNKI